VSKRARITAGCIVLAGAALIYVLTRLSVNADFSAFLPSATSNEARFLVSELKEGVAGRLLLIGLSNDSPERLADTSRALAKRLAANGAFRYVSNGDVDLARRDFDVIRAHRYLLSDAVTAQRFSVNGLRDALAARLRALSSGAGFAENALLAHDPTGETLHLIERLAPAVQPRRQSGVWFDSTGTQALLIAQTRAPGSDIDGQTRAMAALEAAFASARDGTHVAMRYSSPGAMAVEARELIASDAARLAIVSTILVVAILAFVYRSPIVVLFCALPAVIGLVVGVAAVDIAFAGVHAITLGFGATLLGEAVDYPSYLLTQIGASESAPAALARIGRTLALAVLTTAGASAALLFTGFAGLAQLGLLTMVGVLCAGAVTAWVLPHWLPSRWGAAALSVPFAPPRAPAPRWRLAVALALTAALALAAARGAVWDDDPANMNPLPVELKQRDRELRSAIGAPEVRFMLTIESAGRDEALSAAERVRPMLDDAVRAHLLKGFELAADYLPPLATQQRRQQAIPPRDELRRRFEQAANGTPFRVAAFEPFFDDAERARTAEPLRGEDLAGTAIGVKLDALVRTDDGRTHVVVPLTGVDRPAELEAAVARAGVPGVQWVDLQATSRKIMGEFRQRALVAFAIGALLILGILGLGFRSVAAAIAIALPPMAAVVATGALLAAIGSPLTVFHLIALMLVAGIGTNYALFIARRGEGVGGRDATGRSLAVVVATTLCAFGTLATSRTPVLHAIGLTVVIGVALSLVYSLFLRPSARLSGSR
jgi:predicted exporter